MEPGRRSISDAGGIGKIESGGEQLRISPVWFMTRHGNLKGLAHGKCFTA